MRWFSVFVLSVLFSVQAYSQANCTITPTEENPDIKVMECHETITDRAETVGSWIRVNLSKEIESQIPVLPLHMGQLLEAELRADLEAKGTYQVTNNNSPGEQDFNWTNIKGSVSFNVCGTGATDEKEKDMFHVVPFGQSSPSETLDFTGLVEIGPLMNPSSFSTNKEEESLTENCGTPILFFAVGDPNGAAVISTLMRLDFKIDISVRYTFGPRERDLVIRPMLRTAQALIDFDLDGDKVPDLVEGKTTMVGARLKLLGKPEAYRPEQLDLVPEIKLVVGGREFPWVKTEDTKIPTLRNILQATRNDGTLDGLVVRFFFVPQAGDSELKVTVDFPEGSVLVDPRPESNERVRAIKVRRTNGLLLDFVKIMECDPGNCFNSTVSDESVAVYKTDAVAFTNKIFPVADGSIKVEDSVVVSMTGSPDNSKYLGKEVVDFAITNGLVLDLKQLKNIARAKGFNSNMVGIVPSGYFPRNTFGHVSLARGLTAKTPGWPVMVLDSAGASSTLAHELTHAFIKEIPHDFTALSNPNGYDVEKKIVVSDKINYFGPGGGGGSVASDTWISGLVYGSLMNKLQRPLPTDPKVVIVSGFINENRTVDIQQITISEQGIPSTDDEDGDTRFSLKSMSGEVLTSVSTFPPAELILDVESEDGQSAAEVIIDISARRPFVESFVLPDEPVTIAVEQSGVELASINVNLDPFEELVAQIENLPEEAFRSSGDKKRKKLLKIISSAQSSFDKGRKQKALEKIEKHLKKEVYNFVLPPFTGDLLEKIDSFVRQIRTGFETFSLRQSVINSENLVFKRNPEKSRLKLVSRINDFQSSIDKRKKYHIILQARARLIYEINALVKNEFHAEFIGLVNAIVLDVSDGMQTRPLLKLLFDLPEDAFGLFDGFKLSYLVADVKKIQSTLDNGEERKAKKMIDLFVKQVKKIIANKYQADLVLEATELKEQIE